MTSLRYHLAVSALLLALGAGATAQGADARQEFETISKELEIEMKELRQATKALDGAEAGALYGEFFATVMPEFCERFAALARANKGTPLAFDAWSRVLSHGTQAPSMGAMAPLLKEALGALTSEHLTAPGLANVIATLRYGSAAFGEELALASLDTIGTKAPEPSTRAEARLAFASVLGEERALGDPRLERAKETLLGIQKEFGDLAPKNGPSYGEQAARLLFALEKLVVGAPCPDFSAVDAESVPFKLSDYRGKVVLIDFWGFW